MPNPIRILSILPLLAGLGACTTADLMRVDGVTLGAGDAIASNTVMQMVDPWPAGVDDTHLRIPADRGKPTAPMADSGPKTMDN